MYNELYELIRPHTTAAEAQFCAATLTLMPPEQALAMIERIQNERKAEVK